MALLSSMVASSGCLHTGDTTEPARAFVEAGPMLCAAKPNAGGFPGGGPRSCFEDIGNGLIASTSGFVGFDESGSDWYVTDCESGAEIALEVRRSYPPICDVETGSCEQRPAVSRETAFLEFYAELRQNEMPNFERLKSEAKSAGFPVRELRVSSENCGCRAAYPQARGNKQPYEETPAAKVYEVLQ